MERNKTFRKAKGLVCFYCAGPITEKKKIKFCCDEHGDLFENAKRAGRKIAIKINDKTTIYTDKYDRIPEVAAKQRAIINGDIGAIKGVDGKINNRFIAIIKKENEI